MTKPVTITLDMPFPPSTNRLYLRTLSGPKKRRPRTSQYQRWLKLTDFSLIANRQYPRTKITGNFTITITLDYSKRGSRRDADNCCKAILDYLQSREIIRNDADADEVLIKWGDAPVGCRVQIVSVDLAGRRAA